MRRTLVVLGIASCLGLNGCGATLRIPGASAQPAVARVGYSAPSFTLRTLDGATTVSLASLLGKKPIILNAWAAWCENCKDETPDLVRFEKQYAEKVQVVGIDTADNATKAKEFVSKYGMRFLTLNDAQGSFMDSYNILGLPTTIVIAPDGKISTIHPGALTHTSMAQLFKSAASLG